MLLYALRTMTHINALCAVRIKGCYILTMCSVILFVNTQTQKRLFLILVITLWI